MHRIEGPCASTFVKPVGGKRYGTWMNHQLLPRANFPMILETRWGRARWSERRFFPTDRLSRLLSVFR